MIPECEICHLEMVFVKRLSDHKTKGRLKCRRRFFKCPNCDYQIVIYADGEIDLKALSEAAITSIEKFHKQEQDNRDF